MELASQFQILATVILASLLGGVVGFEREISHKPAGIRTNMLVAASAALLVALGAILVSAYEQSPAIEYIKTDPIRIVETIIVGVSFIGGGLIIQKKEEM